jgi:hypothetical protein
MRKTFLFVFVFVLLFATAAAPQSQGIKVFFEPKLKKLENTPRLLIISAFQPELELLLQETQIKRQYVVNGELRPHLPFQEYRLPTQLPTPSKPSICSIFNMPYSAGLQEELTRS